MQVFSKIPVFLLVQTPNIHAACRRKTHSLPAPFLLSRSTRHISDPVFRRSCVGSYTASFSSVLQCPWSMDMVRELDSSHIAFSAISFSACDFFPDPPVPVKHGNVQFIQLLKRWHDKIPFRAAKALFFGWHCLTYPTIIPPHSLCSFSVPRFWLKVRLR